MVESRVTIYPQQAGSRRMAELRETVGSQLMAGRKPRLDPKQIARSRRKAGLIPRVGLIQMVGLM